MSWNDLSMKDKASYIRMGVENGITDLDTIREVYNKFAEGGPVKKSNYYYADSDTTDPNFTDLTPIGEGVYKNKFGKVVYDTTKVTPPEKDKSINDYLKNASEWDREMFDPDMFITENKWKSKIGDNIVKLGKNIEEKGYYHKSPLLSKIGNIEMSQLIPGAKPFNIEYTIPWTEKYNVEKRITEFFRGFDSNDILPPKVSEFKQMNPHLNYDYKGPSQFANGGPLKKSYKDFSARLSKAWNNENLSKHDYDYQKYYNDDPEEAYRQLESIEHGGKGHFPDEGRSGIYKTPNHPTYPDLGSNSWLNDDKIFNISARQAVPENTDRVLDYLGSDLDYNRGATKVMYDGTYQLPEVTVTPDGNYTELVPNELNTGWMYRDRAGRFDDVDYSYLDNYLGNKKSLGGNLYGNGGSKPRYRSSSNIRKQISTWEGATMKTNTPFEKMDTMFNQVLPAGALDKLSQKQLDGLYSFAYNVGTGRFKTRTAPTLSKYLAGQATLQDVQNTMWAAKDSKLRGLANRRKKERSMLGDYVPVQETIPMTTPLATSLDITPAVQPIIESNPVIQGNIETFPLAFNTESQKESYYTPGFFDYVNYINQIRQPKQRDRRIWLTI